MFIVAALLVLAVHHTTSQELGEVYNVTVQQGIPATLKYTVDTRNHTLKVRWAGPVCQYKLTDLRRGIVCYNIISMSKFQLHSNLPGIVIVIVIFLQGVHSVN